VPTRSFERLRHAGSSIACALLVWLAAACAHAQSEPARTRLEVGRFEDASGQVRPFAATYRLYFGRAIGPPHYLHAMAASAGLLAIGTLLYWANPDANSADWELSGVAAKFKPSSIRFDDNKFTTNNFLHPLAGSGYYGFARVEHLSIPAALAVTVGASSLWEFVLEWKEKVSINDLIMTPFGGMAMGECFLRLNDYLNVDQPVDTYRQRAARYSVGLPGFIHRAMHGEPVREDPLPNDELGFSTAYWHHFRLAYQVAYARNDLGDAAVMQSALAETELVAIPGFLRPGSFDLLFSDGNFTQMRARVGFAQSELAELDLWFRAAMFGYYTQDFSRAQRGGHAMAISGASAFEHHQRWLLGHRDEIAVLHLLGPAWDTWLSAAGVRFHSALEASFDFGSIRPAAFAAWHEAHSAEFAKSVLEQYGYAYDWGVSGRLHAELSYRRAELGLRFSYGRYSSIEGLDRYEERITRNTPSVDDLIGYENWIGYQLPHLPIELRMTYESRMHRGSLAGVEVQRWERLAMADVGLTF
jgi:hypothetical protein